MRPLLLSGAPGTGKSTLGRALARRTRAVLLDLDTVTSTLLDHVFPGTGLPGHWNDDRYRTQVRPARYAALLHVAAEQVRLGRDVVLTAPFTAELRGGPEWHSLRQALPTDEPLVVWLQAPDDVLVQRVARRGEPRDAAVKQARVSHTPSVPHLAVDARSSTGRQVAVVLEAWKTGR